MTPSHASTRSGSGPSDAALVVAARAGEGWAREALFRRYAEMVNGLAFRIMGRDADVDDLVQESFAQALASLGKLQNPQAFASWLAAIVVRTGYKTLRQRRMMVRLGLRRHEPVELDAIVSQGAPADVALELRAIYALVDRLPAKLRIALVLRRVEGESLDDIAKMTGQSLATVKRHVQEAERRLMEALEASRRNTDGPGA